MIQLEKVTKFYGERLIFSDVTFKIMDGEKSVSSAKTARVNPRC